MRLGQDLGHVTFEASKAGQVRFALTDLVRDSTAYNRVFKAEIHIVDTGLRFFGAPAYEIVYRFKGSITDVAEQDIIIERTRVMTEYAEYMVEHSGVPVWFKAPGSPHVPTNQSRFPVSGKPKLPENKKGYTFVKSVRQVATKVLREVDLDEVWARNMFEVPVEIAEAKPSSAKPKRAPKPQLEANVQMELPRWINGMFGTFDKRIYERIPGLSAQCYDTMFIGARAEF